MKVAWQFTARGCQKHGTVPLGNGMIGLAGPSAILSGERASRPSQTVPYGTDLFKTHSLAVNCQATFISPFGTTNPAPERARGDDEENGQPLTANCQSPRPLTFPLFVSHSVTRAAESNINFADLQQILTKGFECFDALYAQFKRT